MKTAISSIIMILNHVSKYLSAYDVVIFLRVIIKYISSLSSIESIDPQNNGVFELL